MNFDNSSSLNLPVALDPVSDLEVFAFGDEAKAKIQVPYSEVIEMINKQVVPQFFKHRINTEVNGTIDFVIRWVPCPIYTHRTITVHVCHSKASFMLNGQHYKLYDETS